MNKKMLNAIVDLTVNVKEEYQKIAGTFYDTNNTNVLCVMGFISGIMFTNISREERELILENCKESESKKPFDLNPIFSSLENKNDYPDDWYKEINLKELSEMVKIMKVDNDFKRYKTYLFVSERKFPYQRMFNSVFNIEGLYDVAKCIDNKSVIVHFPSNRLKPIILIGKYGQAVLLPSNRTDFD